MSYIDDLVKLRYLVPMREAANSTLSNINTFQSKDIVKDFLDKIQTNPDGTSRPGGASGLDLSQPESIAKLTGIEGKTLSNLMEMSGGQMNTPEAAGVMNLSDRILKGMNLGSEMSARAGTTAYQQGESDRANAKLPFENELMRQQALLASREPADRGATEKSAVDQQLQADWQTVAAQSKNPLIVGNIGTILKALHKKGNILDNMRETVNSENSQLPRSQREELSQNIIKGLASEFQTSKQALKQADIDQKTDALNQVKTLKVITYKNNLANQWESMDNTKNRDILKNIEIESAKKSGENIDDDTADNRARTKWMDQRLKESGDPDLMPTQSANPLDLNFKPRAPKGSTYSGKTW